MKKLATVLCAGALALGAYAQGTINVGNTAATLISTNATAAGGTVGTTGTALGGYTYGVFTAASTVTTIDASLQNLLTATWTFTGVYATNSAIASGGRLNGGLGVATTTGWTPGVTNSYLILGWSANMGTWASVSTALTGATFNAGGWGGGGLTSGDWLGASSIAFGAAGGGASGLPAYSLISTAGPNGQGTPIATGWDLYTVVPEPGTLALGGLGVAAMLIFRRRK